MSRPTFEMQPLESRRLLSAAPALLPRLDALADCPEVVEARADLHEVSKQLRADKRDGQAAIRETQKLIRAEYQELIEEIGADALHEALAPLKEKLREDTRLKNKELRAAAEELRIAKRQARQQVGAALKELHEARQSGDADAIAAAEQNLADVKAQVQEDLKPIRDSIIGIKDKWRPIITAGHQAIQDKLIELNPDLGPLYAKLEADAAALNEKLSAGVAAVHAATQALHQAIAACRAEHSNGERT